MALNICLVDSGNEKYRNQWNYLLSHFAVDNVYLIKRPEARDPQGDPLKTRRIYINTAEDLPSLPSVLVLCQPITGRYVAGDLDIAAFAHPLDVTYMFGPDNAFLSSDQMGTRIPDFKVYIPTVSKDEMYSFVAAAVFLHDRRIRGTV